MSDPRELPARSEEDLLRAVAAGDRAGFDELYDRIAPWLAARLRRRCSDPALVEEIVQDTFLAVWQSAAGFTGSGAAVGWVWTIARNRMVRLGRRDLPRAASTEEADRWPASSPSAEDLALVDRFDPRLEAALAALSPQLRTVLRATVLDGMSIRDTAAWLRIPESTVKTRAFRARLQMRRALS